MNDGIYEAQSQTHRLAPEQESAVFSHAAQQLPLRKDYFLKFLLKKKKPPSSCSCSTQEYFQLDMRGTPFLRLAAFWLFLPSLFNTYMQLIKHRSENDRPTALTVFVFKHNQCTLSFRATHAMNESVPSNQEHADLFKGTACVSSQKSVTHAARHAVNTSISRHWGDTRRWGRRRWRRENVMFGPAWWQILI